MADWKWSQKLSEEIFFMKYDLHKEGDVHTIFNNIAAEVASCEKISNKKEIQNEFLNIMEEGKFIPAGRILANSRPDSKMKNYNNCFTIEIEDSMDGIYNSLKEDAQISKMGGGVGFNVSQLRPKDAIISKGGESSGPISFLEVFDASAKTIHTGGGRRSAHIAVMNVDHPDIEEFITVKQGDRNKKLTQFNISVGVTDAFIKAVKEEADWDLTFEGKVYKTIKAVDLYKLMTKNAYDHNEPGIFNLDHVNDESNSHYLYYIQQVNPCFTGDTIVATADGRNGVSIKQLADENKDFNVYSAKIKTQGNRPNLSKWKSEIKKAVAFKTGTRNVIEINLSDGTSFKCTPEHLLARPDGSYIEAQNAEGLELEKFYTFSNKNSEKSYRHINTKTNGFSRQYRMIWENDNEKYDGRQFNVDHLDGDSMNDSLDNLELISKDEHKKRTKELWKEKGNPISRMDKVELSYNQSIKNIKANASRYKWDKIRLENALDLFKDQNEKPIKDDLNIYLDEKIYVVSINDKNELEDVYDLTVEDNHNFYILTNTDDDNFLNSSGCLVHNCGEQPLPIYGVCDLGALNLSKFILNQFTEKATIAWDDLKNVIKYGIRFLDDVLSVTDYPLDKIKDRSLSERRIGLGFTGYADMLAKLKLVYGSQESKDLTEKLGKFYRDSAYEASVELAKEKGAFPLCDNELISKSKFIKRLPKSIREDIKEYGLRNIAMLTVAPTGTTSLSLGQNCSSGIEPMFSLSYTRNYRTGIGDETAAELVYDDAWLEWLGHNHTGPETAKELLLGHDVKIPNYFVTTVDIDPKDTIDIQAIWQKYIDASISKTLNLKPGTSYEEYSDLFMYAYDSGLKGFTSFNPDGSLKGILEYNEPAKSEEEYITRTEAPKRPDELECDIHEITVKGQKFIVLVGKLYGSLYEIFLDSNDDGAIDVNHHKIGIIKKSGKSKYSLIIKNGIEKVVIENLATSFDATYGVLARFISMGLRHGTPLQFIVDQLSRSKHFLGFERAVSRVLKKYIKEGEIVQTGEVCPECEGTLEYRDGCVTCPACGFSKCS